LQENIALSQFEVPCLEGFGECGFKGESVKICDPGTYKYKIDNNEVFADAGASSNFRFVKSFKIPKGVKLYYKGQFFSSLFINADKKAIQGLANGDALKETTQTGPTSDYCATNKSSYWRYMIKVSHTAYRDIAVIVPDFLRALMRAKGSKFQYENARDSTEKCKSSLEITTTELKSIETQLIAITTSKSQIESRIKILYDRRTYLQGVLDGKITDENSNKESYMVKIRQLRVQIEEYNREIARLEGLIHGLNDKINAFRVKIETMRRQITIASANATSSSNNIRLQEAMRELKRIEENQSVKIKKYQVELTENSNRQTNKINIEEQIKILQKRLIESDIAIEKSNCDLVKMEDEIEIIMRQQRDQKAIVEQITNQIVVDDTTVINLKKEISVIEIEINGINDKIVGHQRAISELKKKISDNEVLISKWTNMSSSGILDDDLRDKYHKEIIEISTKIEIEERELRTIDIQIVTITTTRNQLQAKITDYTSCSNSSGTSIAVLESRYNSDLAEVKSRLSSITAYYNDNTSDLMSAMNELNVKQSIEKFVSISTRYLRSYLDSLPSDPTISADMFRRRRRLRRRRFI
jgi:chromosome segregation ATPase